MAPLIESADVRFHAVVDVVIHLVVIEAVGYKIAHAQWCTWVAGADVLAVAFAVKAATTVGFNQLARKK